MKEGIEEFILKVAMVLLIVFSMAVYMVFLEDILLCIVKLKL